MDRPLLQVLDEAAAGGDISRFAEAIQARLGGAILRLPHRQRAAAAWRQALAQPAPAIVLVHDPGRLAAARLLDLRERGIALAVFLHSFFPLCPTRELWHRRGEVCSGPGRTGWKCAWCVAGTRRRALELSLRCGRYRQRPQQWRTVLARADMVFVPSRFARDGWIARGMNPDRVVLAPPCARATCRAIPARAADGSELLAAALELVDDRVRTLVANGKIVVAPARRDPAYSHAVAAAQAQGVPVVATARGALAEQIIHGVGGFLCAPDDPSALADAIAEAAAALASAARAWSPDLARRRIELEYEDTLANLQCQLLAIVDGSLPPMDHPVPYRRQLALNHAIAFLRACGCRRLSLLAGGNPMPANEMAYFTHWGLEWVPEIALPDGLLSNATGCTRPEILRRRFPQAKAFVEITNAGTQTTAWLDE